MSATNATHPAMTIDRVTVTGPPTADRVVPLAETVGRQARGRADRRREVRRRATDVWWLRGANIRYGASLRILNIAQSGILIETDRELAPGVTIPIELCGAKTRLTVLSKVVRCRRVTSGEIAWHLTACRFLRPVELGGLVPRFREPAATTNSMDVALMGELEILARSRPQRVIARYRSDRVFSGYTKNFHPGHTSMRLSADSSFGKSFLVAMADLKALVFVRDTPDAHTVSVDLDERHVVRSTIRTLDSERIELVRSDKRGLTVYFDNPTDATRRWIDWTTGPIPERSPESREEPASSGATDERTSE